MKINLQIATKEKNIPKLSLFNLWANTVSKDKKQITIKIVDTFEIKELNNKFRKKDEPTNVLSFPLEKADKVFFENELGDIAICASVIEKEAKEQNKSIMDHWAHITIHGILHLLGYDHIKNSDAKKMEALEEEILKNLNIKNPYSF